MLKKLVHALALVAMTLGVILVVAKAGRPANKDFISYWSAGTQLVEHRNPYSRAEVFSMELRAGLDSPKPLIMRNPPWALFVAYPLGFASPTIGLLFWMAASLGAVAFCFKVFEVPSRDRVLGFCFAPVYASLAIGQSSPFLLLGFTLFVLFRQRRPAWAGGALVFMAMKPHLFLVLLPVIVLDAFYRRSYRVLGGAAVALALASGFATWLDPNIWTYYASMLRSSGIDQDFIPTLVGTLSILIEPAHPWVLLIPTGIAIIWAVHFYWVRRNGWDWRADSLPVLLITVAVSPYAWMTDEIVLLPAIMFALSAPVRARHTFAVFMVANSVALIMLMEQVQLPSGAYLWTSAAWIALYGYSRPRRQAQVCTRLQAMPEPSYYP